MEAHKIQQKVHDLVKLFCYFFKVQEKNEVEKYLRYRDQKVRSLIAQFELKQDQELNALQKRIITGQEEQGKARSIELEKY